MQALSDSLPHEQVTGYESFKLAADEVIKENLDVFGLLIDLLEFKTSALEVFSSLLGARGQFKVSEAGRQALSYPNTHT